MNIKEKLGQLLLSRPRAKDIEKSVASGIVGGLYVPPDFDVKMVKELKNAREIPLIVAADLECGELSGCAGWPCAMAAAQSGRDGVYRWARAQANEARAVGVDAVFGPVFDIVFTRDGIATGYRPLGCTPNDVAALGYEAVHGYQDGGMLTFCKHFPGFGRAEDDAHISLSSIDVPLDVFMREDFLPYRRSAFIDPLLSGVMTGHISAPCIDSVPSPMSKKIIDLLRENGCRGLIMTDSLAMKSIQFYYPMHELYVGALKAGHDLILADYNTPDEEGAEWLYAAYRDGILTENEIDEKVSRILKTKKRLAEFSVKSPDLEEDKKIFCEISKNSIKAGKPVDVSKKTLFVIADEAGENVGGEVAFSNKGTDALTKRIKSDFDNAEIMYIDICPSADKIADVLYEGLKCEQTVFVVHAPVKAYAGTSHFHKPMLSLIDGMKRRTAAVCVWGNPFAADDLPNGINAYICYDFGDFANSLFDKLTQKGTSPK